MSEDEIKVSMMSGTVQLLTSRISVRHGCLLSARRSPALRWLSSGHRMSRGLKESYRILQLPEEGSSTPAQVEEAYRAVLTHQSKIGHKEAEEEEEDEGKSRGAALQHRHYLSFDGVGSGTPSQRERQYRQVRVDRAAEQVLSYRQREHERGAAGDGALVERDTRQRSRKIKITQAVERLVEDLIQESMARGDFRNLSGAGKPLSKFQHNPYADPMTHNLNRILIDNGYQPPWVVTQRDIREGAARIRARLLEERARLGEQMTAGERRRWEELCASAQEELLRLNKLVDNYNLIVPMLSMQMVHFSLTREVERAARGAQQRRLEVEEERQRRKEEKRRANVAMKSKTSRKPGLLSWMRAWISH
uniref:DnaJ (Hsp40) homolog, subfamily C, member 28 n=1 Tax=Oryzias latipes TaxID=8090 RepID=A0A3P9JIG0_ORYLA